MVLCKKNFGEDFGTKRTLSFWSRIYQFSVECSRSNHNWNLKDLCLFGSSSIIDTFLSLKYNSGPKSIENVENLISTCSLNAKDALHVFSSHRRQNKILIFKAFFHCLSGSGNQKILTYLAIVSFTNNTKIRQYLKIQISRFWK